MNFKSISPYDVFFKAVQIIEKWYFHSQERKEKNEGSNLAITKNITTPGLIFLGTERSLIDEFYVFVLNFANDWTIGLNINIQHSEMHKMSNQMLKLIAFGCLISNKLRLFPSPPRVKVPPKMNKTATNHSFLICTNDWRYIWANYLNINAYPPTSWMPCTKNTMDKDN